MTWDRDQYLAAVLEPARKAGNVPPPDLFARYGLPDGISSQVQFERQVADVLAFWRELKSRRMYARLAETLIAAHAELERAGQLTVANFAERHTDARRGQLQRLTRLAEAEAGAATHVGRATVFRLRGALGGAVSEAETTQALRRAGVRIVEEFPDLPPVAHPKQADLARHLQQIGAGLSAAVVFGDAAIRGFRVLHGFRLADGRTLDEAAITAARHRVDVLPHADPAKAPSENALAILRAAARKPAELDALLLSEVVERLRPLARSGFVQRAIAAQARDLGLDADEAGVIAAAIGSRDTLDALRQQVEEELAGGRLRGAQRLAAGLPADDPQRNRVAAVDAEVAAVTRRAREELTAGRPEQAASLLAEAIGLARDDTELAGQLAAVPPPPPREAAARMDGDHVLISWQASLAKAGQVRYRVVRGLDRAPGTPSEGTAVVAQTDRTEVTDPEAPPGTELFYSVFATRGGESWSPPAPARPALFTPDVTGLLVTIGDTSVTASWRPHPRADCVHVVRRENTPPRGPQDGTAVDASLTGFAETGLDTGTEYHYRIMTSFRAPDGQRRYSAGVLTRAVPEPAPRAVTDLEVTGPAGGPLMLAAWTPPPYGQVRLVRSETPLPWPAGTDLRAQDTAGLSEIPGTPRRGTDGRDVLELALPPGRHHLLAVTAGRNVSVAGSSAVVWLVEPVRGLAVTRLRDEARLSWIWPDRATDAVVRWPGGQRQCSRRQYEDEGGLVVSVGAAETTIEVRVLYPHPGEQITSPVATVRLPGRGIAVSYRIRSPSRWHPRQRTVEILTEQATRLPRLVVVCTTGRYAPDDPAEGQAIAHVEPRDIAPGQPVTVQVEVERGPGWVACFVDPGVPEAEARAILLFPPGAEEMRIR